MKFVSNSPKETQKIASDLAQKIIKTKNGVVIALEGELGAGKTVFVKGFAEAIGIKSKIKSPTFVLMRSYKIQDTRYKIQNLYHLDCYRIAGHKDLRIPELEEVFNEKGSIVLVEWAERIKEILPKKHITIHIDHVDENKRKITIK